MYFFLTVRLCRGIPTGKSSSSSSQSVPTGCWCCGPAPCPPLFPAVKKTGNRTTTYDNSVCVFKKRGRIDRYIYIYIRETVLCLQDFLHTAGTLSSIWVTWHLQSRAKNISTAGNFFKLYKLPIVVTRDLYT